MKEAVKHIGNLIVNLLLIPVAFCLVVLLILPAFFWKVYASISKENRKARDILSGTATFFRAIAICIDLFGNVAYGGFFNNILSKQQRYKFGSPYETISEVLGWLQYYEDLTPPGKVLVAILDWIDKNHCEKTRIHGLLLAAKKINHKQQQNETTTKMATIGSSNFTSLIV